jgi:miniconductance mechanosensitive channel
MAVKIAAMQVLDDISAVLRDFPWLLMVVQLAVLLLATWVASMLARSLLVHAVRRALRTLPDYWYEALVGHRVVRKLAATVPALVVHYGIALISGVPAGVQTVVQSVAGAYVVLTLALAFSRLMDAFGTVYESVDSERANARPIKGYLQLVKIGVAVIAVILMIATLFNRDPLLLLSGLGAMTAVLMLVFKDTLLSLVASMQLSGNDMLRVGDWIEMPNLNADGDVIDISLHTVKVQNWDHTITTIPTWRLISESFKNWRGMQQSGGRRIKRALYIDKTSIRFLGDADRKRMERFALLHDYLEGKQAEIDAHNQKLRAEGLDPVNARNVTNLGTFRAYVEAYLRAHPRIHHEGMTLMVRQLQPEPTGLPLQLYCFTTTVKWTEYEAIQADIFDHLFAILPEFGLRVFQQPTGSDIAVALQKAAAA